MKRNLKYQVITGNLDGLDKFEEMVGGMLEDGWKCCGGVFVDSKLNEVYQAMTIYSIFG